MIARIYKIHNDIDDKLYIGATTLTLERRFKLHVRDARKKRCNKRPLYSAMNEYGHECFHIEIIEECSEKDMEEREQYWIKYYNTFRKGYNATMGGKYKTCCDRDKILELWQKGKTVKEISSITKYDAGQCSKILTSFGITSNEKQKRAISVLCKPVIQIDTQTGEEIQFHESISAAERAIGCRAHIKEVCNGTRKTSAGYKWRWAE